jgi:hypothetical protein
MSKRKRWNSWPVTPDENGNAVWIGIGYDVFERWVAQGMHDETIHNPSLAEAFADALADMAQAEQKLIPLDTRADCVSLAQVYIERWNDTIQEREDGLTRDSRQWRVLDSRFGTDERPYSTSEIYKSVEQYNRQNRGGDYVLALLDDTGDKLWDKGRRDEEGELRRELIARLWQD